MRTGADTVNCEDKQDDLALYAGGDLAWHAAEALEKHLESCPECRRRLEELKKSIALTSSFSPAPPPADEFLAGVRSARARVARKRAALNWAVAILLLAVSVALFYRMTFTQPAGTPGAPKQAAGPVEVERVGYDEAVVRILPTRCKSMTVVWIVSDEVVEQEN